MLDYFELTGKTLLSVSDEIIEAAHSTLRTFDVQKGTEGHVRKQRKSTVHFNAKNWVIFKSSYLNKTKFQLQQFQ